MDRNLGDNNEVQLPPVYLRLHGPTRPTLFPYTTLFRSLDVWAAVGQVQDDALLDVAEPMEQARPLAEAPEDRQSTRLNSSHSSISYAVSCLRKKNQHRKLRHPHLATVPLRRD